MAFGALPRPALPEPHGLPGTNGRSASTNFLSRPAQASLTLRPADLLAHLSWTLSRGSHPGSYPPIWLASYPGVPTPPWSGTLTHWWFSPLGRTFVSQFFSGARGGFLLDAGGWGRFGLCGLLFSGLLQFEERTVRAFVDAVHAPAAGYHLVHQIRFDRGAGLIGSGIITDHYLELMLIFAFQDHGVFGSKSMKEGITR